MKIAVCIKEVPASGEVSVDPAAHRIQRSSGASAVNQADLNALTEAVKIKTDTHGEIDVFTMGPESAKSALFTALAMGADRAFLICDPVFAGSDALATAKILASALSITDSYDLILCGALSSDGSTGEVGPMMAQLLSVPSISEAEGLREQDGYVEAYKSWNGKRAHLRMSMPGLITIALGSNMPILPTLRNRMKARKETIHKITNADLKLEPSSIGLQGAKSLVEDTYMKEIGTKHAVMLCGDTSSVADQILALLRKAGEQG